jgi:fatty-acyl-CoA synthase
MTNLPINKSLTNPYDEGLDRNQANFQPLTPLVFLARSADVFPDQIAIIHGQLQYNYHQFYTRARQLASALNTHNVSRNDTVSVMLANTPAMLESHYGVPMCAAVLHSINTRLDSAAIAFQLDHAQSKVVIVDSEFMPIMHKALEIAEVSPLLISYHDAQYSAEPLQSNAIDYEAFINSGDANYQWLMPEDEWDAISINYTSGTTGDPKGVVSHHRGAYLLAQGNALTTTMQKHAVYLWTLPMFHCNGWCFPWTMSIISGTHVCLRQVRAEQIWRALNDHQVSHLCGAPIVMSLMLAEQPVEPLANRVHFLTAAAPPPEKLLSHMQSAGFDVLHLYGLTETYGPAVVNDWHTKWDQLPTIEQAELKARQGVRYLPLEALQVLNPETMRPVEADGKSIGEVMFRGNVVMKGYFKNPAATEKSFAGGWFHSGDLAVVYPDGYIQLRDRSKDIIISGGENISSIEIESVLYKHPAIAVAAVVAMPDTKWGERPCAFVELTQGAHVSSQELIESCRNLLASYKLPARIEFREIPRTSTGKIQKFKLRQIASNLEEI